MNNSVSFDSFKFRKGFEEDKSITNEEKSEIIEYLKSKIIKGDKIFIKVKAQIEKLEFASDYFQNPYPRKFRGA